MPDTRLDELLAQLDASTTPPDEEFAERLRLRFLAEAGAQERATATARRGGRTRPVGRPAVALATVVVVLAALVLVGLPAPPSALAALEDARARFEQLPSYRAHTRVMTSDRADDPDLETVWETEDVYLDASHWRTEVTASNSSSAGLAGDFRVFDGEVLGAYRADTGVFTVTPSGDVDGWVGMDPSYVFDPRLQWWSNDGTVPSDALLDESCSVHDDRYLGREATRLVCEAAPGDLEFVVDDATGMLLRIVVFDLVREITRFEVDPVIDPSTFVVAAPAGATVRWGGSGPVPEEYVPEPPAGARDRIQVVDPLGTDGADLAGLSIDAVRTDEAWLTAIWCGDSCRHELLRVDLASGEVTAAIALPPGTFAAGLLELDGVLWARVAAADTQTLHRVDRERGALAGPVLDLGAVTGGVAAVGDDLWIVGGEVRPVEVGPAETTYAPLRRVDPGTGDVTTQLELEVGFVGAPVVAGDGGVWVRTQAIDPVDPYATSDELVRVDPADGAVTDRVVLPFAPWTSPVLLDGAAFLLHAQDPEGWFLSRVDLASGAVVTAGVAPAGAELGAPVAAGGSVWLTSFLDDAVLRVDPVTLEVVERLATGRGPSGVASDGRSLWVSHTDGTLVRFDLE